MVIPPQIICLPRHPGEGVERTAARSKPPSPVRVRHPCHAGAWNPTSLTSDTRPRTARRGRTCWTPSGLRLVSAPYFPGHPAISELADCSDDLSEGTSVQIAVHRYQRPRELFILSNRHPGTSRHDDESLRLQNYADCPVANPPSGTPRRIHRFADGPINQRRDREFNTSPGTAAGQHGCPRSTGTSTRYDGDLTFSAPRTCSRVTISAYPRGNLCGL